MKNYHTTKTTVSFIRYNLVFCPRYRRQIFTDTQLCAAFTETLHSIRDEMGLLHIEANFGVDYVHLIVHALPQHSAYDIVKKIRVITGRKIKEDFPQYRSMEVVWTRNFLATTKEVLSQEDIDAFVQLQRKRG
ncbi:MAG: IS200/IS605 family transposase [Kurthia sp.]|nr:IS200/IS605 family transposase [Candidatus Kurthia equi]